MLVNTQPEHRRGTGWHPVTAAILRKLVQAVVLLLFVSGLTFTLESLAPGDAAENILGLQATPQALAQLRAEMGLNRPLWEQYWDWLRNAAAGNLGTSVASGQPVSHILLARLPVTLSLVLCALLLTSALGIGAGVLAAARRGWLARGLDALALLGFALPSFWLASELVAIFCVRLAWFPAIGYTSFGTSPVGWLRSLVLPVSALSLASIAFVAKQTYESMTSVGNSEYVRMARAHGIPPWSVLLRYCLRNAAAPTVTVIGLQAVGMLAGTLFVENVFSLPGLGSLLVQSALGHDLPTLLGVTTVLTIMVVIINATVDATYSRLNPKVRNR
jgi:peptide/nickel transport system permease protein